MTAATAPDTGTRTLVIAIRGLSADAFIGSGCCVVLADDAVRRELESWPGVIDVSIDPAATQATVVAHRDRPEPADLVETVESMGFAATLVTAPLASGGR